MGIPTGMSICPLCALRLLAGGGMQNGAQPHGQFPPRGAAAVCPIFAENRLSN
ncbi:hypothetical protein BN938_1997 [Mucinivorans hirudinis]|uniref:Uncharacterized protein n=1 Tax=Mucinivorans hirudinis TaxID=1433126 RepID=A0A060RDS4_9BACT|nr:hypothetical protein BN938_1997 [Mucinivorans hirudinis]